MSDFRIFDGAAQEAINDLKEAERLFEWAMCYERKGLQDAADALRDEGRKALQKYAAYTKGQAFPNVS